MPSFSSQSPISCTAAQPLTHSGEHIPLRDCSLFSILVIAALALDTMHTAAIAEINILVIQNSKIRALATGDPA
jgi:hypothetical protein